MRVLAGIVVGLYLLAGCVTTSTGGLPPPEDSETRLEAHLALARGYLSSGDFERARETLNRALEIDSRSVEAYVLRAAISENEQDQDLAEEYYDTALSFDRNNSQALNNYASFLYSQERYSEALPPLRRLVNDVEYHARAQAYENLGLAELKAGDRELAKNAFSRALRLDFSQARSALELADLAYVDGDYRAANEYYQGFRSRARQNARSLCLGMKLGQAIGDADQLASYTLALQNLFPNSPEATQCLISK
jgi:type IV pilus assembly protein PilF